MSTEFDFDIPLKKSATRYKQKTEIIIVTRPPTCRKFDSCFWFLQKYKKQIGNLTCRNYSDDYFYIKMSLKFLVKSLLHSVFSLIT